MQDQPIQGSPRATHAGGYTVMHTLEVLQRLALRPHSVPELCRVTGRELRSVRRIAGRLRTENYIVQDGGHRKRYRPTMRLAGLGLDVVRRAPLPRLAQPLLAELASTSGGQAHLWIAAPGEPIDLARPVMREEPAEKLAATPAGAVLDPRRDHLRSVSVIRHADRWIVTAAVMDRGRVAAAVGLSCCDDLLLTRAVVEVADRLTAQLRDATAG